MNITKIISKTFDSRLKQIDLYASQASEIQHRVLSRLTRQAAQTEWESKVLLIIFVIFISALT